MDFAGPTSTPSQRHTYQNELLHNAQAIHQSNSVCSLAQKSGWHSNTDDKTCEKNVSG